MILYVPITKVKQYLRVDSDDDDIIINSLITVSQEMVQDVLRKKLEEFDPMPETILQAILFTIATLYENRQAGKEGLMMEGLIDIVRRMVSSYREDKW